MVKIFRETKEITPHKSILLKRDMRTKLCVFHPGQGMKEFLSKHKKIGKRSYGTFCDRMKKISKEFSVKQKSKSLHEKIS